MKARPSFLQRLFFTALIFFGCIFSSFGQDEQTNTLKNKIESKHYTFQAQTAYPTSGRSRNLDFGYTLKVSGDSVISDLPYYGRAYSAPSNLSGGGITFSSAQSEYSVTPGKKDSWEITIKLKDDVTDVQDMQLTVYNNGTADLKVNSRDRQPISFRGQIKDK